MMAAARVVVVGAGPAGLATSHHLTERGIDHLVLERGRVAERWRSERWDSLRLLTPNWLSGLPGWDGDDPDGFMTMPEVVTHLQAHADALRAPVVEGAEVLSARPLDGGFVVRTRTASHRCDALVVASGATPAMPTWRHDLADDVAQLHSSQYRNPAQLPHGGVLVVGASASGLQIADELARSGRDVVLAVGNHVRLPRRYRDVDVHRWLDMSGLLEVGPDQVADVEAARRSPSLGLVGSPAGRSLDLDALARAGVRLVGRAVAVEGTRVRIADDLAASCERADRRLLRLLALFDQVAVAAAMEDVVGPVTRPARTQVPPPVDEIDLASTGIGTVLWATGFRHVHPWLDPALTTDEGALRHRGGIGLHPGTFALGLPFMRRRSSPFLDGIRQDAAVIAAAVAAHLERVDRTPPTTSPTLPPRPGRRTPALTGART
jgi:putative flavoprotein involved in K+ transport